MLGWKRVLAAAALVTWPILAAGCGPAATGAGSRLQVVAAENVYGDLARQIGGIHVDVTSILANPNADPHLFTPTARTGLAVATARVVIYNGAGYDDWMIRLLAAAPSTDRRVVTVADVLQVSGPDPNPHLWYDVPGLPRVIRAIGEAFTAADPAHAAAYRAGTERTLAVLHPLQAAVDRLRAAHAGAPVAYTERVPGLLLAAAGLRVLTPPSFARAVEDGTDPAPADVATMQRLLTDHEVKALLYNEQAGSPVTDRLRRVAEAAGIPVVPVTETAPAGQSFVGWQLGQITALAKALGR